jgi:hypothetical protein
MSACRWWCETVTVLPPGSATRSPPHPAPPHLHAAHIAAHNVGMRVLPLLLLLLALAGCVATPEQLGITGPQATAPLPATIGAPEAPADPLDNPDQLQSNGTRYGPNPVPSTGTGRFWGYN